MARPSTPFSWAASPPSGYVAAPPGAVQATGFGPADVARGDYINWTLSEIGAWVGHLAGDVLPQDGEIRVGRITGIGDPQGTGRALHVHNGGTGDIRITTTGAGNRVEIFAQDGPARIEARGSNQASIVNPDGGLVAAFSLGGRTNLGHGSAGSSTRVRSPSGDVMLDSAGVVTTADAAGAVVRLAVTGGASGADVTLDRDTGEVSASGSTVTLTGSAAAIVESTGAKATVQGQSAELAATGGGVARVRSEWFDVRLEAPNGVILSEDVHVFADTAIFEAGAGARGGIEASANPSTGLAYGYSDGVGGAGWVTLDIDMSPCAGGYDQRFSDSLNGDGYVERVSPVNARRPIPQVVHNPGAVATVYRAVHLAADFNFSGLGVTTVTLYARHRTTGADTALLQVQASGGTSALDDNGGTPINLDPGTYIYFVAIEDSGGTSVGIRGVTLRIQKAAVE